MSKKITKEKFIDRAVDVHGARYDYSNVVYETSHKPVEIICPIHGSFFQSPSNHYQGKGCKGCGNLKRGMERRLSQENFIGLAKSVHGDKYDYSLVDYKGSKKSITIICPLHGKFSQKASNHLRSGCKRCGTKAAADKLRNDTRWFIEQAKNIHGDIYDYREVIYTSANDAIKVICPTHGMFEQQAFRHLRTKTPCPKCGNREFSDKDWVERFKSVHGDEYDYTAFHYKGRFKESTIICKIHGAFEQTPNNHYAGRGCQKCAGRSLNNEEWVERFKEVHGNRYSYSKFDYKAHKDTNIITCGVHGDFMQSVSAHLRGSGCPNCAREGISDRWNPMSAYGLRGFYGTEEISNLYVMKLDDSFIKVGLSKDPLSRMNKLYNDSGYSVEVIYTVSGKANHLWDLEQKTLRHSNLKRFYPEESFAGSTECLHLSELPKVLETIEEWEKENVGND